MRIVLDAMGTDAYPSIEVQGALQALRELGDEVTIVLVGDREGIEAELEAATDVPRERLEVLHAPERIDPSESPVADRRVR